jgi:hypothetical protein
MWLVQRSHDFIFSTTMMLFWAFIHHDKRRYVYLTQGVQGLGHHLCISWQPCKETKLEFNKRQWWKGNVWWNIICGGITKKLHVFIVMVFEKMGTRVLWKTKQLPNMTPLEKICDWKKTRRKVFFPFLTVVAIFKMPSIFEVWHHRSSSCLVIHIT